MAGRAAALSLAAVLAACGGPSRRSEPRPLFDFATFSRAVADADREASEEGSRQNCATALPPVAPDAPNAARRTVLEYVASALGVSKRSVAAHQAFCGGVGFTTCATVFKNDLLRELDVPRGKMLLPLARIVEEAVEYAEVIIWVPKQGGQPLPPVVSIAGIRDGRMLGIAFFAGNSTCR